METKRCQGLHRPLRLHERAAPYVALEHVRSPTSRVFSAERYEDYDEPLQPTLATVAPSPPPGRRRPAAPAPRPPLPSRPALVLGVEGQQERLAGPGDGALYGGVGRAFSRGDERLR